PLGEADIKREGKDATVVCFSRPVHMALEAAEQLKGEGIDTEIVDIRSIRPLDNEAIFNSVKKTNRCVVVDEAWPFAGVGSYIGWLVSRNCFDYLDAPVELVSLEDVPMPYNHKLELAAGVSAAKIAAAVKRVLYTD
ncbi:MAG: alpha-ketoacid dehydrogenase subunit beta, partial [Spirochaetes bacterium]|nr:alpha-ketoacid dehydrogenase subunit beta [Spirochaetota bacterium]